MVSTQRSIGLDNAKLLYDYIRGDNSNWLFFLGGETGVDTAINTIEDDSNVWESVNFLQKVRDSDVSVVARRVNWKQGNVYYPYESTGIPAGETGEARNYYAVTDEDEVFVCLGSDEKNRYDRKGSISSTIKPSRDKDNQTLKDGYRWKFLYKIDLDQVKFKTTNYIPVPDINEYDIVSSSASLKEEAFKRGCGLNTGQTGACCLYHKRDAIEPITDNLYNKGQLDFCIDNVLCSKCFEVARGLNREFIFRPNGLCGRTGATGSTGCAPTKTIKSGLDLALENSKFLSPNSNTRLQSDVYKNAKSEDGQIHNVFIDLSGLTEDDLTISLENPKIVLSSQTGENAVAQLTTYKKGQSYVVDGIRLVSGGSGYRDVTCASAEANLQSRITFSLDYQGGLFADPRRLLGATKVMIKVVIRADRISTDANTDQSTFTRYGLFRDVEVNNESSSFIAGSGTNRNETEIFTNKFKVTLKELPVLSASTFSFDEANPTIPTASKISNSSLETTEQSSLVSLGAATKESSKIISYGPVTGVSSKAKIETITGKDLSVKPYRVGDVISDNVTGQQFRFEVESIDAEPTIKPFSGTLVSSNTTNITTSTAPKEVSFQFVYTLGSY